MSQILSRKSRVLAVIKPDRTVFEALKYMSEHNVGSIIVTEKDKYLGVLTERDYARKVALVDKSSKSVLVSEIMSTNLPIISSEDTIDKCMRLMSELNIRYLPVLENDKLIGIVSVKDLVDEQILEQKNLIESLTSYISQ